VRAGDRGRHGRRRARAGGVPAVVCQFGAMFFPEKAAAYAEARRVLRPGGRFIFNV